MGRLVVITLWVVGLTGLALVWENERPSPAPSAGEQALARSVAQGLEALLEGQRQAVRDLARELGAWESLPEEALAEALRVVARRRPDLGMLLVADEEGRLLAGYDALRPIGRERLPTGSLDPALGRGAVLSSAASERLLFEAEAGLLGSLQLAVAIRRSDGSRPAYLGATLRAEPLRETLAPLAIGGVALHVDTPGGHRVFPCQGQAPRGGARFASASFVVTAKSGRAKRPGGFALPALISLLLLASMIMATWAMGRAGREALPEESGAPPGDADDPPREVHDLGQAPSDPGQAPSDP